MKPCRSPYCECAVGSCSRIGCFDARSGSEPPDQGCAVPPGDWYCSREPGHDGPCATRLIPASTPIDMVLHCPGCRMQHIDAPEPAVEHDHGAVEFPAWDNPPHRSHLCHSCGLLWRPADVPTNGVQAVKTRGSGDSPPPEPRRPDGYAYEYPGPFGGLRFTNGEEQNGCKPLRALPYWLGTLP